MPRLLTSLQARVTDASHRVTTLELFFDLVYVFAFTQVTAWIAHEHSALGTTQGVVTLAILWWTWAGWSWLGNTFHAAHGLPMLGFLTSAAAVFALSLTIRDVWSAEGGTLAPVTFVACYVVVRACHAGVYLWAAREEPRLRKQVIVTAAAWMPAVVLLAVGAFMPVEARLWWWTGTLALDLASTWLLAARVRGWAVRSPGHFAERFGLMVMLALGESVVAVGVAGEGLELDGRLIGLSVLGVGAAVALWWPYFRHVAPAAEHAFVTAPPERQPDIARDSYTYLHLPLVAGVILMAAGVEEAVIALEHHEVAGVAGVLMALGSTIFCAANAALLGLAGGRWLAPALAAAVCASAALWAQWLSPVTAIAAIIATLVALAAALARHPQSGA